MRKVLRPISLKPAEDEDFDQLEEPLRIPKMKKYPETTKKRTTQSEISVDDNKKARLSAF